MKLVEKVPLENHEYEKYKRICKQQGRSLRRQTAKLIRDFILHKK